MSLKAETRVALHAARAAAGILGRARPALRVRHKGEVDLVTQVDLACEHAVREVLGAWTPDIPVLGEEGGGAEGAATRWVVDPLDGTTNFVHGVPIFGVSVALEVDGEPVVGVIIDAVRGVEYVGARGEGARADGAPLRVSACEDLAQALIGTGFPYDRLERAAHYLAFVERVMSRARGIRRMGAATIDLALVASGCLDGFWEFHLHRWDVAAGIVLVGEAGGRVTAVDGGPLDLDDPCPLVAGPRVHDALLRALRG